MPQPGAAYTNESRIIDIGSTPLGRAAKNGDVPGIVALCEAGAALDKTDVSGRNIMSIAAEAGRVEVVQWLLEAGAEFKRGDHRGITPLAWAAGSGHTPVLDTLIRAGAPVDPSSPVAFGSALCVAARGGHVEAVQALLSAGASLEAEAPNWQHRAALALAVAKGHVAVVKELLKAAYRGDGVTSLEQAKAIVNAEDSNGHTAMSIAATLGSPDIVEELLSASASLGDKDSKAGIALHHAAKHGHVPAIEILLREDPSAMHALDNTGNTALGFAAMSGHLGAVNVLLGAGAKPNLAGKSAFPLMLAARYGQTKVVQALLVAGAAVNQSKGGSTALDEAAGNTWSDERAKAACVRLLLANGAKGAASALKIAKANGRGAAADILQAAVAAQPRLSRWLR